MLAPEFPVRTERLLLRPPVVADAPELAAYQSRPEVCRFVPYEPRTAVEIRARIPEQSRASIDEPGQALWFAVLRVADEALIGDVMLFWHSREHAAGEIGYVFSPDVQGHGYATEAAGAPLTLGFDGLGLHRIVARLDARNTASAAVAKRLGMRQEAHLVENEWFKGGWSDELVYAILAPEWRARNA